MTWSADTRRGNPWKGLGLLIRAAFFLVADAILIGGTSWRLFGDMFGENLVGGYFAVALTVGCLIPMMIAGRELAVSMGGRLCLERAPSSSFRCCCPTASSFHI